MLLLQQNRLPLQYHYTHINIYKYLKLKKHTFLKKQENKKHLRPLPLSRPALADARALEQRPVIKVAPASRITAVALPHITDHDATTTALRSGRREIRGCDAARVRWRRITARPAHRHEVQRLLAAVLLLLLLLLLDVVRRWRGLRTARRRGRTAHAQARVT